MITAKCHPALRDLLPEPKPAAKMLPEWLREMPSQVAAPSLNGDMVRTLKHCPPVLDAFGLGVMVPLAADILVEDGQMSWDWNMPVLPDTLIPRAPLGLHVPEQTTGAPFKMDTGAVVKFMNFWTFQIPDGYSLLCVHPLNRDDLPFRTLAGVVDCDRFTDGYVHFPALWHDENFTGVLPKGTPIAQLIAVPRAAQGLALDCMSDQDIAANRALQERLGEDRGTYRKTFRH